MMPAATSPAEKRLDRLTLVIVLLAVILVVLFMRGEQLGLQPAHADPGYARRLFDASRVHQIDLVLPEWDELLATAPEEVYFPATVVIDGERINQVGLRIKGNNSRRLIHKYGLTRYSLKLEFDHYVSGRHYHGLDKLSLDASFQDNSYLKNYLSYRMMDFMAVPSPLCSYAWVTVNGEPWGLFLALEEPEEAFARRVYGPDHGQLYKPGYRSLDDENADVHLRYVDDQPESYDNIFRKAKFRITAADQARLIEALRILDSGENLGQAVEIDQVLRYFTVQVFVVNLDSYLGRTGHNYFLYEKDGRISMLPWDYNLAFATYSLGMPEPVNDATLYVNYPINTPAAGEVMFKRPLFHKLMKDREIFKSYHRHFDTLISTYFESGRFEHELQQTAALIAPYVAQDPTAFCSFDDHQLAVDTLKNFCLLRARSVRGQLDGTIPSTFRAQSADPQNRIDASVVWLPDLGEIADLRDQAAIR